MGKIGSIIGQAAIAKLRTKGATGKPGSQANPYLGIFTTLCIPETKRKTLEELSGDDIDAHAEHEAVHDNVSEEVPKERAVTDATAV
jgi:PHS family inorganic phosphate transporter-like MFS transporter